MKTESPAASLARAEKKLKREALERMFDLQCRQANLPEAQKEGVLIPGRKWRVDRYWPECMVCVEIQGATAARFVSKDGQHVGLGRHSSREGLNNGYEKHNALVMLGWCALQFSKDHLESGYALKTITEALRLRPPF